MDREEFEKLTAEVYVSFYRGVTLKQDYTLPGNKINSAALRRFSAYAEQLHGIKMLGVGWIIDFIELSFHWWYKKDHISKGKYSHDAIKLNWIIGEPAIDRYEKLQEKKYAASYFRSKMRVEIGLKIRKHFERASLRKQSESWLIPLSPSEEIIKKELYNQPEGLVWCASQTTMFNHLSPLCSNCFNRTRCLDLMKKELPKLYELRGYDGKALRQ